jgi:hypothetical protein
MDELTRQRYKAAIDMFDKSMADKAGIIKNYFEQLTPKQKMVLKNYDPSAMVKAMPPEARAGLKNYDPSAIIKAMPSLEPMISKGSGIGLGKILQSGAKVAQKVMPYASGAGAALTAFDLGQALSEVQDKGAAKIAEDYKKEQEDKILGQSEKLGGAMRTMDPNAYEKAYQDIMLSESEKVGDIMSEKVGNIMQKMNSLKSPSKQYSPEERMKLKEMLSKYRANAALRSAE